LYESGTPITVSGSGTGLTGSRVPNGGVVISTERLTAMSFDESTNLLSVEPGVVFRDVNDYLEQYSRFLPPNPTEWLCSIGGAVSTNASGSRTFKYGAMREWVHSLEVILANGEIVTIQSDSIKNISYSVTSQKGNNYSFEIQTIPIPSTKHAAGYYVVPSMRATDLFVGSEGTLGFIQSITLKTLPKEEVLLGGIVFFDNYNQLLQFVNEIRRISRSNSHQTIQSRLIEFFDENSLNLLRKFYNEIPKSAIGAIWFEQESNVELTDVHIDEWWKIIAEFTSLAEETWFAQNEVEHRKLSEFRHKLPSEVYEVIGKGSTAKIGTDMAVPTENFDEYFWEYQRLLNQANVQFVLFGHIGNCHLHANMFPKNDQETKNARNVYDSMITKALKVHGTISAEHGVGKLKKQYFQKMYSKEVLDYFLSIKSLFDPKSQFGKGNLF
jgi:D-lactate dehydrogenase (cytochrome)